MDKGDNVVEFPLNEFIVGDDNERAPSVPVESVLEGIRNNNVNQVFVVGIDDNDEIYIASSMPSIAKFILTLERAKLMLLTGDFSQS